MMVALAPARTARGRLRRPWRSRRALTTSFSLLAGAVLWQLVAFIVNNPDKLPSPVSVAEAFWPLLMSGEIVINALASLQRVAVGFVLAAVVGIPIGLIAGLRKTFARLSYPLIEILRPIPAIAIIPILLSLLGIGEALSVTVVFFAAVFPIIINVQSGVRQLDRIYFEVGETLGVRKMAQVRWIVLPGIASPTITGLRVGLQLGWMSIIGAEFIGSTSGLGYMILYYEGFLQAGKIVAGMAAIGLLGFVLDRVVLLFGRACTPWINH